MTLLAREVGWFGVVLILVSVKLRFRDGVADQTGADRQYRNFRRPGTSQASDERTRVDEDKPDQKWT